MPLLTTLLFILSATCAATILGLGLVDWVGSGFRFWPPPEKGRWQDRLFIWFFRGMLYPLIALSFLEFESTEQPWLQLGLGGGLVVLGFGTALASTLNLGWSNAFGDRQGLVTGGWFAWSRNPVYMVTWIGLAGWAILVPSPMVWIILAIWALIYLIAVFLEERWLEDVYGDEFRVYRKEVRRFL
jgi:protein-S-isoprenylcysteine O-methyltransferase Ste14